MIAKPAAMPGICGANSARPIAEHRGEQQRPQPVDEDRGPGAAPGSVVVERASGEQALDRRVGLVPAPEPRPDRDREHPPARDDEHEQRVGVRAGGEHGDDGERGGRARAQDHRRLEEVDEAHRRRLTAAPRAAAAPPRCRRRACRPRPRAPAASRRSGPRRTPPSRACPARRACAGPSNASMSVRSSPTYTAAFRSASRSRRRMPRPLSMSTAGRTSSTLRPQCVRRPAASARSATLAHRPLRGILVRRAAPVERRDGALVLGPHAQAAQLVVVGVVGEPPDAPLPRRDLPIELDLGRRRGAAARRRGCRCRRSSRWRRSAARPRPGGRSRRRRTPYRRATWISRRARRLGDRRVIGVADDRSERPVHVEQHAGTCRIRPEGLECLAQRRGGGHGRSMARPGDDRWSCDTGYPQVGRGRPGDLG